MPKQLQKIDWENDDNWLIVKDGTRILKVLKDGCKVSTSMMAMDAANATHQQAMFDATESQRSRNFGLKDAADLRRPGFRFQTDAAGRDAKARAYHDYETSQGEAWRSPPTGEGSHGTYLARPGNSCADGRAGHLREIDGELVCVADNSIFGEDHALNDRELAHAEHRHYLENAWRSPDRSVQVPDRGPVRGSDHAMTDREAAYAEYQSRVENAWRGGR